MAREVTNEFSEYKLTELEYAAAIDFTINQRQLLQTLKSKIAQDILRLSFKPDNMQESAVQHQWLTGKMEVLDELLLLKEQWDESVPEQE